MSGYPVPGKVTGPAPGIARQRVEPLLEASFTFLDRAKEIAVV